MSEHRRWTKSNRTENNDHFAIKEVNFNQALGYYNSMLEAWGEITEETSRFMNGRLDEDLKLTDQIMKSETSVEAAQVQSQFLAKMFADYSIEQQRLLRLAAKATPVVPGTNKGESSSKPRRKGRGKSH